ncbi:MAG: hypothetical protein ABUL63_00295, partial [Acidobacteriota bacterium]
GGRVLLGEVKWSARPFDRKSLEALLRELIARPAPPLPARLAEARPIRVLFVPETAAGLKAVTVPEGSMIVTAEELLG